ncbi:MAG: YcaO-like family protein [Campylobacterales bacterium]|nr:YcaO-like family protein [Campylobacterales bacterium]
MHLLSKNASLEESIAAMQHALDALGCKVDFSLEKHPLGHCYSVNLASAEAPRHLYANGKGIYSKACVASALGEYIERLQTNNFFSDFYLPQRVSYPDEVAFELGGAYLNAELEALYDPANSLCGEDFVDFNSDHEDKVVALPFVHHTSGASVYFPVNIVANLYVSNGLASGNTPAEAQVQALSEMVERYVKREIIKHGYALPAFPKAVVEGFPRLASDVKELQALGYKVEVLDASLGGKFPVTAISLINQKNNTLFVSFGAHPLLEVSLERTMTELMQGRGKDELESFETPTFDMGLVDDNLNLESHFIDSNGKVGFSFLSSKKSFEYTPSRYLGRSSQEEFAYLCAIIAAMGKEIYVREYRYLGFYSCHMLVPGMSEVYPIEDLVYNNKNQGKLVRALVLGFQECDPEEVLDAIEAFEDSLDVEKFIGVIFAHPFTMGELKAQLHLLRKEYAEAMELLEYASNPLALVLLELLRMQEAQCSYEEHQEGLWAIFGEKKVEKARAILEGKEYLIDTTFHADYVNMLALYDKLAVKKCGRHDI